MPKLPWWTYAIIAAALMAAGAATTYAVIAKQRAADMVKAANEIHQRDSTLVAETMKWESGRVQTNLALAELLTRTPLPGADRPTAKPPEQPNGITTRDSLEYWQARALVAEAARDSARLDAEDWKAEARRQMQAVALLRLDQAATDSLLQRERAARRKSDADFIRLASKPRCTVAGIGCTELVGVAGAVVGFVAGQRSRSGG